MLSVGVALGSARVSPPPPKKNASFFNAAALDFGNTAGMAGFVLGLTRGCRDTPPPPYPMPPSNSLPYPPPPSLSPYLIKCLPRFLDFSFTALGIHLILHATRRTPNGASRLGQAMSAWSVKTRRAPSRHCRDARVYGHTTTAMHDIKYIYLEVPTPGKKNII